MRTLFHAPDVAFDEFWTVFMPVMDQQSRRYQCFYQVVWAVLPAYSVCYVFVGECFANGSILGVLRGEVPKAFEEANGSPSWDGKPPAEAQKLWVIDGVEFHGVTSPLRIIN